MRKFKKFLCAVLTSTMVLAMAAPSFADVATPTTTITINDGDSEKTTTYAAYRLLDASQAVDDPDKYAYIMNSKYESILSSALPEGTPEGTDVIAYIASLKENNAGIQSYADAVYRAIIKNKILADATSTDEAFNEVKQGYYLIVDTTQVSDNDTISAVMLDTAGRSTATIEVKKDAPTVDKKIVEGNNKANAIDAAGTDTITYELTGTLPSNLASYETYKYEFVDTLSAGLDFVSTENDVEVKIGDAKVDAKVTINGRVLTVTIDDVKSIDNVTAESTIVVRYSARLNENAIIGGSANTNNVKISYSNNPYGEGEGTTPGNTVKVFTYQVTVNKKDAGDNALEGAAFTLSKQNADGEWTTVEEITSIGKNNEVIDGFTTFNFKNLDKGIYKIEETRVPDGYNKAEDIVFTLDATIETVDGEETLTGLTVTNVTVGGKVANDIFNVNDAVNLGTVSTDVHNVSGSILPSTGGIGTTIFYAAGIILMAGAVFFVVRRKKA